MPRPLKPAQIQDIQALDEIGYTPKQIQDETGLAWNTVAKYKDKDLERFEAGVNARKRAWIAEHHVIAGIVRDRLIAALPNIPLENAGDARNFATVGGIATDKILAAEGHGKASQPASLQMFNSSITVSQEVHLSPSEVAHLIGQADRREAGERTRSDALDAESVSDEGRDS